MTAHSLTTAALANADVLRTIRDQNAQDIKAVLPRLAATFPDIRRDSLKRSLDRLIDDDIIELRGQAYHLTAAGARALLAMDVAEGRVAPPTVAAAADGDRWPIDRLYPNPDNPTRPDDQERDANFRESIIAAGDLLQPLVVSPVDATGGRMIWDGHRRWENCTILARDGALPPKLAGGLPFIELEIDPAVPRADHRAIALRTALIANEQRAGVPPWEDAKLLALYADLTGEGGAPKSARQVALDLGRAHPGSETGVKDVQRKIAVVRKARAEDIARHERGDITWEQLRETVEEKKKGLTAKQLMVLAEICEACVRAGIAPDKRAVLLTLPHHDLGGDYGLVMGGLIGFDAIGGKTSCHVYEPAWAAAREQAGYDPTAAADVRDDVLLALRSAVVNPARAMLAQTTGRFIVEWLNVAPAAFTATRLPETTEPVRSLDKASAVADRRQADAMRPTEPPAAPDGSDDTAVPPHDLESPPARPLLDLTPTQRLAMFELGHKVQAAPQRPLKVLPGSATYAVRVGRYWLSADYTALKSEALGLIVHEHSAGSDGVAYAALTRAGEDWLEAAGFDRDPAGTLAQARRDACAAWRPGVYATDWLNIWPDQESKPLEAEPDDDADEVPPPESSSPIGGGEPPPQAVVEGVRPVAGELAELWLAAGDVLNLLHELDEASENGPPVSDERYRDRRFRLQMALMAAAVTLPKAVRDQRPEPPYPVNLPAVVRDLSTRARDCKPGDLHGSYRILQELMTLGDRIGGDR